MLRVACCNHCGSSKVANQIVLPSYPTLSLALPPREMVTEWQPLKRGSVGEGQGVAKGRVGVPCRFRFPRGLGQKECHAGVTMAIAGWLGPLYVARRIVGGMTSMHPLPLLQGGGMQCDGRPWVAAYGQVGCDSPDQLITSTLQAAHEVFPLRP